LESSDNIEKGDQATSLAKNLPAETRTRNVYALWA